MTHVAAFEELLELARRLRDQAGKGEDPAFKEPVDALSKAAELIGLSSSQSWLGYHANVYYDEFHVPPPGAHFSKEWGLMERMHRSRSNSGWRECDPEKVKAIVRVEAGNPDLTDARKIEAAASSIFSSAKAECIPILESEIADGADPFLERCRDEVQKIELLSPSGVCELLRPKGQLMTRDATAAGQGTWVPPHIVEGSEALSLLHTFRACEATAEVLEKAGSYLARKARRAARSSRVGTNVFIGHGRSSLWRELKDFIQDRARLPYDEFNRVPVAGVTNIARLLEMLDAAAIAFLIMTGEDELADGAVQARMNVIHEAGLFQGRLGFTKAIILLEEGCSEFSNVQGLGQVRFPKGNISAAFEEIRRVLEREGLIEP
jgi:predicted nucleotide-binding protein